MAGNAHIGALFVSLGIDTAVFSEGLKDASSKLKGFQSFIGSSMKIAGLAIAAGAAAGGAALVQFGGQALTVADDIGDAAARIGVSASAFQKLQIAAVAAGGSTEVMGSAMDKLNQNLGKAKDGSKGMIDAFGQLGIKAADIKNMTADQAFYAIADGIQKIQDPATKAKLSMELFGKAAGVDMLEVLGKSGAELKAFGDAAANSGRVMSDEMVAKLSDAKLALDNAKTSASQMATVFAGQALIGVMDFAKELKPMFEQMKSIGSQVMNFLKPSLIALGDAFKSLSQNETLMAALKGIGTVLGVVLVGATKLAIDAITGAIRVFDGLFRKIGETGKWLSDSAKAFINYGKNIVEGLVKGFGDAGRIAMEAVKNLGANVLKAFRAVLGINSPSKEAEQDARWFIEGFNLGIKGGIPKTIEQIKALGEAVNSAMDSYMTPEQSAAQKWFMDTKAVTEWEAAGGSKVLAEQYRKTIDKAFAEAMKDFNPIKLGDSDGIFSPEIVDSEAMKKWSEGFKEVANDNGVKDTLRETFSETFSDGMIAALDGDFGNWFSNWWKRKAATALEDVLTKLGNTIFDTIKSGGGIGGIFKAIGSIFGGARANGGTVEAGKTYLVGERGMEMFTPNRSGYIVPNHELSASNVIHLHTTNQTILDGKVIDERVDTRIFERGKQLATNQRRKQVYGVAS